MSASLKVHTLKSHYVYFYNTTHKSFSYTSASVSRCSRCSLLGPLHWLPLILSGVLLLQLLRPFPHRLRLDPGSHPGVKRTGHQRVTWRAGCCRCELEPPHSQRSDWMWCHDLRRHLQNGEKKGEQTEAEYFELRWKLQVLFVDVVCSADSTQQSVELHKIAVMWIHILLF